MIFIHRNIVKNMFCANCNLMTSLLLSVPATNFPFKRSFCSCCLFTNPSSQGDMVQQLPGGCEFDACAESPSWRLD